MAQITFIPPQLFQFAYRNTLKSEFRGAKKLAHLIGIPFDANQVDLINPQVLFKQLTQAPIDLDVLQVFALMGWETTAWKQPSGRLAMRNWWLSALNKKDQSYLHRLMILRSVLADTERYPAPKDVVQVMRDVLHQLIRENYLSHMPQVALIQAILAEDVTQVASLAMEAHTSVIDLIATAKLPQKLPTVQEAHLQWLNLWVLAQPKQRQTLRSALNQLLHQQLSIERQVEFAKIIFEHSAFSKQVESLKLQVKHYPELVAWLSHCARDREFKKMLSHQQRQMLGIWIGTGNYESLKDTLTKIAMASSDASNIEKTSNRYIFWKNYQHFFQEAWLLLPEQLYAGHLSQLPNIKKVHGTAYPIVVLKVQDYFVFQYFLGSATENDLLMTDAVDDVEKILSQSYILNSELTSVNLVLIHDHFFKWQSDLAYTLDQHFNLAATDAKVNITHSFVANYRQEVGKQEFIETRKEWKNLPKWVKHHLKHNYPSNVYQKAAITVKRHELLN